MTVQFKKLTVSPWKRFPWTALPRRRHQQQTQLGGEIVCVYRGNWKTAPDVDISSKIRSDVFAGGL